MRPPPPPPRPRGGSRGPSPSSPAWVGGRCRFWGRPQGPPPPPGRPPAPLAPGRPCAPAAGRARKRGRWRVERCRGGAGGRPRRRATARRRRATLPESRATLPESGPRRPFSRALGLRRPVHDAHDAHGLPRPSSAPCRARGGRGDAERGGGSPMRTTWAQNQKANARRWGAGPPRNPGPAGHLGVYRPYNARRPPATPRACAPRSGGPGTPYAGPWARRRGEIEPRATLPESLAVGRRIHTYTAWDSMQHKAESLARGTRKPGPPPGWPELPESEAHATPPEGPPSPPAAAAPPENRPRPRGRPPPRRFALFGPGYPRARGGPPPGRPLLTDPGTALGCAARPGTLWCAPRVSEKPIRTGVGKNQLAVPPTSPGRGPGRRTRAPRLATARRPCEYHCHPRSPRGGRAAGGTAGGVTRKRERGRLPESLPAPGLEGLPGSLFARVSGNVPGSLSAPTARQVTRESLCPSAGPATREPARASQSRREAARRPKAPRPRPRQATRKPPRSSLARAARRQAPAPNQVRAALPESRPGPDEQPTTPTVPPISHPRAAVI